MTTNTHQTVAARFGARVAAGLLAACALAPAARSQADVAPLKVLASMPTYGALARAIGGDAVDVFVPTRATQDIHTLSATPSIMARVRDVDIVLSTGLDAEGWLEPMLRGSGNADLFGDPRRMLQMSDGLALLEVPSEVSRRAGDIHAFGNTHVWTDPLAVRSMALRVRDAFIALRPNHAAGFTARHADFHQRLTRALVRWLTDYQTLKHQPVVSYHKSWAYFFRRFGLVDAGTLEPKPRVAPTASHLDQLVKDMQTTRVRVILREPHHPADAAAFVAEHTLATVLELSTHPGFPAGTDDIVAHFEHNLAALATALGVEVSHPR